MAKPGWRPAWDREGREPRWATDAVASRRWHNPFGGTKYLWGNTPAVDIIQLEKNEGLEYREEMSLLFAGRSS